MKSKWLKRTVSALLAAVMVFSVQPPKVFAEVPVKRAYGDVNTDGNIDVKDALLLQKHLVGMKPNNFNQKYADVNGDSKVDLKDLLNIKKFIANWDIDLGPALATVSFYDGDRLIDEMDTVAGEALGKTPSNEKTSRSDAIFLGWYTDPSFKTPFYADAPVTADTKVYARYSGYETSTLTVSSFAQLDLAPDTSFTVVGTGDTGAITLRPMDGSEPVDLAVTGSGPYTVSAPEGFKRVPPMS